MNPSLIILTASVAVVGSNALVLSPIAGAVATSFPRADASAVMVASAVYGLGTALSALTLAPMADRIGAARLLRWALLLMCAALAGSAAAPTLALLCIAQGLTGIAAGAALPATYGLAAQIAPAGRESETLGVVLTGWTLSMVAGVSVSALLADLAHWRAVFLLLAIGAGVLAWLLRAVAAGSPGQAGASTSPLTAMRVPGILPVLGVCFSFMVAFYGSYAFLGVHLQDRLGLSTAMTGLAPLAYGAGFGIAARLDRLIDRHGAERVSLHVFMLLVAVYGAMALGAAIPAAAIALCFLWGLINHLGLNLVVGRLSALQPSQRGAIMGLYSAVTYVAMFAATMSFRPLFDAYGFAACAALSGLCVLPALADAARLRSAPAARLSEPA